MSFFVETQDREKIIIYSGEARWMKSMFLITTKVNKGIIFLRLYGSLNKRTIKEFSEEINYLLYEQGTKRLVINFDEVNITNDAIFGAIGNKLIEIFLSCGEVALCGLSQDRKDCIGSRRDQLFFVDSELDAFRYLSC